MEPACDSNLSKVSHTLCRTQVLRVALRATAPIQKLPGYSCSYEVDSRIEILVRKLGVSSKKAMTKLERL